MKNLTNSFKYLITFIFTLVILFPTASPSFADTPRGIAVYSGGGLSNTTNSGWTDNHMLGQTFVTGNNTGKITGVVLTNFKIGDSGAKNDGIVSVALFAGSPTVTNAAVPGYDGTTTNFISAGAPLVRVDSILVGGTVISSLAELCGVPKNTVEAKFLKRLKINNPERPCPHFYEWNRVYALFTDAQQGLRNEWWNTFNGGERRATYDGESDILVYQSGVPEIDSPYRYEGPTVNGRTSWLSTSGSDRWDLADSWIELDLPDNKVAPNQTYFVSVQQSHTDDPPYPNWDQGEYFEQGRYNCEGPNQSGPIRITGWNIPNGREEALRGNPMCGKGNLFYATLTNNNLYPSGQAYYNDPGFPNDGKDAATLNIYGEPYPTATISGPSTGFTSSGNLSFAINTTGSNIARVEAHYRGVTSTGDPGTPIGNWFEIPTSPACAGNSSYCSVTATWAPPRTAGTYWVAVNAFDDYNNMKCTGNPWTGFPDPAWFNCGSSDAIKVTISSPPTLGALQIKPDIATSSQASGTYTISGLRSGTEQGSNYYNAITITPNVANSENAVLIGAAFTSKASPPGNQTLYELTRSAFQDNGFVLIYVKAATATTNNVSFFNGSTSTSKSFTASDSYYAYFNGIWSSAITTIYPYTAPEIKVERGNSTDPNNGKPQFSVTLYKALSSHNWGTYSYIMDTAGNETSISKSPSL